MRLRCAARRAALHRRPMRIFPAFAALALTACATSTVNEPSLARRPAEAIDPRLPIASAPTLGPVDAALAAQLARLIAEGRAGAQLFDAEVGRAQALANAAGPAQSDSWILAQQALSGLEGARARSTRALADVDAIAAARIQGGTGLNFSDMTAIDAALSELRALTDRQATTFDRLSARLRT